MTVPHRGTARDIARMEASSDAVLAIGITLPVVKVRMARSITASIPTMSAP